MVEHFPYKEGVSSSSLLAPTTDVRATKWLVRTTSSDEKRLKSEGVRPLSSEGEAGASWVLLDYGDVVAHFFDAATRSFYDLEGMWADAPREAVN